MAIIVLARRRRYPLSLQNPTGIEVHARSKFIKVKKCTGKEKGQSFRSYALTWILCMPVLHRYMEVTY
jgi:hypothetical protein